MTICPGATAMSIHGAQIMQRFLRKLSVFVKRPATQLVTGLILLVSAGPEVVYDFLDAEHRFRWGVHHGVALFGLMQMLGSLPDVVWRD